MIGVRPEDQIPLSHKEGWRGVPQEVNTGDRRARRARAPGTWRHEASDEQGGLERRESVGVFSGGCRDSACVYLHSRPRLFTLPLFGGQVEA